MDEKRDLVTEQEERSLDVLLKLPYSDMTEEELERVIDYKAECRARDADYQAAQAERSAAMEACAAKWADIAASAQSMLDQMAAESRARLNAACGVEEVKE